MRKIGLNKEHVTINPASLETLIDQMTKGSNHHPRDTSFRLTVSEWAEPAHITFGFPGRYLKKLNTNVVTEDGKNLKMDHGVIVLPDNKIIKVKSAMDVEQQTQLPDDPKIKKIFDYVVNKIHETNLPAVPVIITSEDPGSNVIDYEVYNHVMRVHYIIVTPEKISKRLNILRDIVETRREFTVDEVLNFTYIAIFVKTDAKEIMEETTILFSRFPKISPNLKIDVHQVLKKMILHHFQDDLKKAKELLYMITINFTNEEVDKMNAYEREIYEKDVEIIKKDAEITRITREKNDEIDRITKEKNDVINKKDNEINRLNEEIEKLKNNKKSS